MLPFSVSKADEMVLSYLLFSDNKDLHMNEEQRKRYIEQCFILRRKLTDDFHLSNPEIMENISFHKLGLNASPSQPKRVKFNIFGSGHDEKCKAKGVSLNMLQSFVGDELIDALHGVLVQEWNLQAENVDFVLLHGFLARLPRVTVLLESLFGKVFPTYDL